MSPQAAARSTLGSGLHTTTKASVSAPPSSAVVRREMPRRGASPPRSARRALPGGPISRIRTIVRLLPDTARRCVRSVASKASCSSGRTREVSPTTRPGRSARASGARSSVASRSPALSPPAVRCTAVGGRTVSGNLPSGTRSTAAMRSPPPVGGASRAVSRSPVDGSNRCHRDAGSRAGATTRTGVRTVAAARSGPAARVTRVMSALSTTDLGIVWSPRTRGRVVRASEVTVSSTVTCAYWRARAGTGPRWRSAACNPPEAAPAAAHSRTAATAVMLSPRRTPAPCSFRDARTIQ